MAALGPRLDLRQSQSLVMTPQLQQAIRLLALSNLEVESFIAEEIERNPLLEAARGEPEAPPPTRRTAETERRRRREVRRAPDPATADELVMSGDGAADAPLDIDLNGEDFHQDSAADAMMRPRRRPRPVGGSSDGGRRRGRPRFRQLRSGEPSRCTSISAPRPASACAAPICSSPTQIIEQIDETGYFLGSLLDIAQRLGAPLAEVERVLAVDPDLRSRRGRRAHPRRMPRAPGEGRRPLRPGDGAADRQSRLSRQGQSRRAEADLRRRRRGSRRHDPRASRLRSQARLPLHDSPSAVDAVVPDMFVARRGAGWAVELNSATLPRLLVNRTYYAELASGAAGPPVQGLAQRMPAERQLADEGARPARPHHRQGGERDRHAAGRLLPPRRLAAASR